MSEHPIELQRRQDETSGQYSVRVEQAATAERRRRDWLPLIIMAIVNLLGIGVVYGKLDQRVTTLELLRIEARAEVSAQLAVIDAKLTRLLERRP